MAASPSSNINTLTAEVHRLYAILVPTGSVQVIIPDGERQRIEARYKQLCAELEVLLKGQKEQKAQVDEWVEDIQDALPALIPMLPGQFKPRIEAMLAMSPGAERDDAMRKLFNQIINGQMLNKMGPMGLMLQPMLSKWMRKKK